MRAFLLFALLVPLAAPASRAQDALYDADVSWRGTEMGRTHTARVRVFASGDERRPHTVVIDDRAANGARPITDEAAYVADRVAREVGVDPVAASFVFRFTEAAFVHDGRDRGKALLVKVTFRRMASGALGSPSWRVLTPEGLEDLTDRAMR